MQSPPRRIVRRQPLCSPPAGLHPVLARVYAQRGLDTLPPLELSRLAPPDGLPGIDRAAALVADAITRGGRLLVVGDYDADGATSTALVVSTLRACGADAGFLVPDRLRHGYGLTPGIVEVAAGLRPDLLITVDNGIASLEGVARAKALGMRVLVTDHHLPGERLPDADAILNPNLPGCSFPGQALAGVGVAFYLLGAVRRELRARGWFGPARPEPNVADGLDLVALGTVADVVPLDTANRTLVEQGLRRIRAGRCRPGIAALIAVAGRDRARLTATDLGYALGPRLNAAGRIDDMALGIRCLLADTDAEATALAQELDALNRERRRIEGDMQQDALRAVARLQLDERELPAALCLYDPGWHQGIVGLVASRLKERCHRPVAAFAPGDDAGNLRGSVRSIEGLHVRDALAEVDARHPGLIARFGGHAMAAGLTLPRAALDAFRDAFHDTVQRLLPPEALQPVLYSDGELDVAEISLPLAEAIRFGGPWGQGFPEPLFDGEFELLAQRIVGERHLKLSVAAARDGSRVLDAIAFNIDTAAWPRAGNRARLAFRLDVNEYRGVRTPQLIVEQIEPL